MQNKMLASDHRGFTLIELILVISLIGIMSTLAVTRMGSLSQWQQREDLRRFTNTWEMLFNESMATGKAYRLVIDLDNESYHVREEIPLNPEELSVTQVDNLANLRLESEQQRRSENEANELPGLEEEYQEQQQLSSDLLDRQFQRYVLMSPGSNTRLALPLKFPKLAKPFALAPGLEFLDIKMANQQTLDGGSSFIRFSPMGASEFAVVHLKRNDEIYSVFMNPATGSVRLSAGYEDFTWNNDETRG